MFKAVVLAVILAKASSIHPQVVLMNVCWIFVKVSFYEVNPHSIDLDYLFLCLCTNS